jgi:short-subunit dehydrogenase
MNFNGRTALVTGASSGLGEEFASQLAAQGCNLVLVAPSEDKMNRLAETLRQRCKVQITVIAADLSSREAVQRVIDEVNDKESKSISW